jgi:diketogulonate reductase-like aldo/keto reductase
MRRFGDAAVPAVGMGTWKMEQDPRAEAVTALRRGIELGLTHVDTAEMYGDGRVETIVGEALQGGLREKAFLVSKVLPSNASHAGTLRACERSLKALRTDRLDSYLLHWPGSHPLEETLRAFEDLVRQGKIRSWGVSNFDVPLLEEAFRIVGPGKIRCNQVLYNVEERTIEHAVLPWCAARGIAVVAYSPLCAEAFPRSPVLERLARARGVSPRAVAMAFLLRDPSVLVIPKSSRIAHLEENAKAGSLDLDAAAVAEIDAAFPRGPWRGLATA